MERGGWGFDVSFFSKKNYDPLFDEKRKSDQEDDKTKEIWIQIFSIPYSAKFSKKTPKK